MVLLRVPLCRPLCHRPLPACVHPLRVGVRAGLRFRSTLLPKSEVVLRDSGPGLVHRRARNPAQGRGRAEGSPKGLPGVRLLHADPFSVCGGYVEPSVPRRLFGVLACGSAQLSGRHDALQDCGPTVTSERGPGHPTLCLSPGRRPSGVQLLRPDSPGASGSMRRVCYPMEHVSAEKPGRGDARKHL